MIHYTPIGNFVKELVTTDGYFCYNMGNMTFVQWLEGELLKRHWKRSDLARESGLTDTAITLMWKANAWPSNA